MTRDEALKLVEENVSNRNIVKHMLATEAVMKALCRELSKRHPELVSGSNDKMLNQVQHDKREEFDEEEWGLVGLLHDGDYMDGIPVERQGIQIAQWAEEKGFNLSDEVKQAMASHNAETKIAPQSKMDWSIFACDSLTGLIVASALVLPSKKLTDLTTESILKRFKEPSFARGTRRDDIKVCEEQLGISLEEFVKISLAAMQGISNNLGL